MLSFIYIITNFLIRIFKREVINIDHYLKNKQGEVYLSFICFLFDGVHIMNA